MIEKADWFLYKNDDKVNDDNGKEKVKEKVKEKEN